MRQLILDLRPDSTPDFANFLPGPNAEPLSVLRDHAAGMVSEPVVYLWGEAGTGKSHLLSAWSALTHAHASKPLPEPPVDWLAVDEVDRLGGEDQVRLFNLINSAREGAGKVLACGPVPPGQLALRADLATRLAQGLVFRLAPLSDSDKIAAINIRAEARGLRLGEEIVRYLLTHSRRDLPHLLGMVDALDTHSLSKKRPVSIPLLKELLQRPQP